jgi:P27 family predicted phage terminase small subunit
MGVLGYCDALVLGRYCDTFIQWREARDFLRKHGATYLQLGQPGTLDDEGEPLTGNGFVEGRPILGVKSYPQVKRSESLDRALIRFEDRLGLSPSARTRLRVSAGAAAPKPTEGGDDGGQTAKGKYFKISDARTG